MAITRRLVVTGHDAKQRSIVAADVEIVGHPIPGMPGHEVTDIWGSDHRLRFPDKGERPKYESFFPAREGFRFLEVLVPAGTTEHANLKHGSAKAEVEDDLPGYTDTLDPDRPGMHRSESVDMLYVVEGSVVLVLDDGEVTLHAGDTAVQSGTIHVWRNPFDKPCRFLAVVIGADLDFK